MIDPKLLTAENGFALECVVEVTWNSGQDVGYLHLNENELWLKRWIDESLGWDEVDSIRPLTGPMAIWNFAPRWAVALEEGFGIILWKDRDAMTCDDSFKWQRRPFWAKVTKDGVE